MIRLKEYFSGLSHLFFPHLCMGCEYHQVNPPAILCPQCIADLPFTDFAELRNNAVEKIFYGRQKVEAAMSLLYFAKSSVIQNLVHQLKYKKQPTIGTELGKLIGLEILEKSAFEGIDLIVPLPLYKDREKKRGYNQAALLCKGIGEIYQAPVSNNNLVRTHNSETQTKKHRRERWQNVEGIFSVNDPSQLENKKILLVDDIITTGATLEACISTLSEITGVTVCIATLAVATE